MKIRNGFVSNSSSTSFVIYNDGVEIGTTSVENGSDAFAFFEELLDMLNEKLDLKLTYRSEYD